MSRSLLSSVQSSREPSPSPINPQGNTPCVSYLELTARNQRKSSYKRYGAMKSPEPGTYAMDPSIIYQKTNFRAATSTPDGGAPEIRKKSTAMLFLPSNNAAPVLVFRKRTVDNGRKESFDSGIGMQVRKEEEQRRKQKSRQETLGDVGSRILEVRELCRRLSVTSTRMEELENCARKTQVDQKNSNLFKMQLIKLSDATELEKGVIKVIETIDFDRRTELVRLRKKSEDFLRRLERNEHLVGDAEELRDLTIGMSELEKKMVKAFEEIQRLQGKTEKVENRQRKIEETQRVKKEKLAMASSAMQTLLADAKKIDDLLSEVREFQISEIRVAEAKCQEYVQVMGEESAHNIQEDLDEIDRIKDLADEIKNDIWEDRLESNRVQTALVDEDPTVNISVAIEGLKDVYINRKIKVMDLRKQFQELLDNQAMKYDKLLAERKEMNEKLELQRLKEEEERRRKAEEERERIRLQRLKEEEEKRRLEEEERKRRLEEEEKRKRAEEERKQAEKKRQMMLYQMRLKAEIQRILNKEAESLSDMKKETESVELQQREIELVFEKRRELCTDPNGLADEKVIAEMLINFTDFVDSMQRSGEILVNLGSRVEQPDEDADLLMKEVQKLSERVDKDWERLDKMKKSTNSQAGKQVQLLNQQMEEIRRKEEEAEEAARRAQAEIDAANAEAERLRLLAEEQQRLLEEEKRKRRLREEEEAARYAEEMRRLKLLEEEERLRKLREAEEERRRREAEEAEMRARELELLEMQRRLEEAAKQITEIEVEWRQFSWDETPWDGEYAGELIGFLNDPALLCSMIRDPKKTAEILRRVKKMAALRERIRQDAIKLEYITKAIKEMKRAAKIAEEKRWKEQNTVWIKDDEIFRPADMICSTQDASFTPNNFLSLDESRKQVKERKISREKMVPVTIQELAKHSKIPVTALEGSHGQYRRRVRRSYLDNL